MQTPWVIRFEGDQTEYANGQNPGSAQTLCNGAVVVRSLVWPGAYTIYQNGNQVSVYCGNGLKFDQKTNPFPLNPPQLAVEAEEYEVCSEPNPKELPKEEVPGGEGEGENAEGEEAAE